MSAAALANALQQSCKITLVESDDIGITGVGEATIPPIKFFNQMLGINESEFLKHTHGTFKLGIQFIDWAKKGHDYFHPFGQFGAEFDSVSFYQYWLQAKKNGSEASLYDHSLAYVAAMNGKFDKPSSDNNNVKSTLDYAYHFDAVAYAKFLRGYAEHFGVRRVEGKVVDVNLKGDTGFIHSVRLADGEEIQADLFVDCTGFKALLIEGGLKTGYVNWNHWLPCDRAVAVPCKMGSEFTPYTKATAKEAGWQWRIPLQNRTGNGYVYSSSHIEKEQATNTLMQSLEGEPLTDPKYFKFTTGHRRKFWHRNCVAIGLSSGFLEPLESTSLHLIQTGILRLIALFPDKNFDPMVEQEYNRITLTEYESVRDFLILHYCETTRDDSPFWQYCANMDLPGSLQHRMEHFRRNGYLNTTVLELFQNPSWWAVLMGQNVIPENYSPIVKHRENINGGDMLSKIQAIIRGSVNEMPSHRQFIESFCKVP